MKRTLALFLSLLLVGLLAGCLRLPDAPPQEPDAFRSAIEAELACNIRGDEDGAYRLFYPGAVEPQLFHQVFTQSQSYFPVREGYTLTMQSFDSYQGINTEKCYTTGWYTVETGGEKYYLYVDLASDDGGTGFRQWNVFNEADYQTFQQNQKK